MPIVLAFCRTAASVRFMALATSAAGVLAFECALSCSQLFRSGKQLALALKRAVTFGIYSRKCVQLRDGSRYIAL